MATDGVTNLDVAHVPDKTTADVIAGDWSFTKAIGNAGGVNFVRNGNLQIWLAGTSVAPTNWTLTGAGATVARDAANFKLLTYAAGVTRVGTDCYLGQNIVTLFGPAAYWQNKILTFGCWVRATVASRARLAINDGVSTTNSSYHTGGSAFEWLTVTKTIAGAATQVEVRLVVDTGNTTAQFDGATLVLGSGIQDFVPGVLDAASTDVATTVAEQWQFALPIGNAGGVSWTFNGDMEMWGAGTAAAPTGWVLTGAAASVAKVTAQFKIGTASAGVTRAGTNCYIGQNLAAFTSYGPVARWQSKQVTFGAWVRATVGSAGRLTINDGVGTTSSSLHSGGSTFEWLQVTRVIDAAATVVEMRCEVLVDTTVHFDGITLVRGASIQDYVPSLWRGRTSTIVFGHDVVQGQATTWFYAPGVGIVTTEANVEFRVPFKCVASRLYANDDLAPAAGQTSTFMLRKNQADTTITAIVTSASRSIEDLVNQVEYAAGDFMCMRGVNSATSGSRFLKSTITLEEIP